MLEFIPNQILLYMAIIGFITGVLTLLGGILILILRVSSKDMQTLTSQTAELANKSLTENFAGILGTASTLLDSMNQLSRTTAGIGIFLCCLGLTLMVASCVLIIFLYKAAA